MSQRLIRRAVDQSRVAVRDLLEALLVSELIAPGKRLRVISPWISDFPVLDNRSGQFASLDAQWSADRIRFSSVLRSLLVRGVEVSVACRRGTSENEFVARLRSGAESDGTGSLLVLQRTEGDLRDRAHEKALIADGWALHGSMNFTYSGVEFNGELVTVTTEPTSVATIAAELAPLFL